MKGVNPRLVYWIAAVHKQADLSPAHRDILTYLAVMRLDYGTGAGYSSVRALASGRGWDESTIKRALDLAQRCGLIVRTRRGHRLGDGTVAASEWQLIYPPMPTAHGSAVEAASTAQRPDLNSAELGSQQRTPAPPSGSESSTGNESSLKRAVTAIQAAVPGATEREIREIVSKLEKDPKVRYVAAYLRAAVGNGDAPVLVAEARNRLAEREEMAQMFGAQRKAAAETAAENERRAAEAARAEAGREEAERAELARWREENGWDQAAAESRVARWEAKPVPAPKPRVARQDNDERNRQLAALEQLIAQTDIHANGQPSRQCAAEGCAKPVDGKRPGAIYCSKLCKNRQTHRRSRAKRRTRAALKATP